MIEYSALWNRVLTDEEIVGLALSLLHPLGLPDGLVFYSMD